MKSNYLFRPIFKTLGWILFAIGVGFTILYWCGVIHDLFPCTVISIIPSSIIGKSSFWGLNEGWEDEIAIIILALSLLWISFAREKDEDEYISHLRLESWIWSILVNTILLIIGTLFIYGIAFLYFSWFYFFSLFLLFIGHFYYKLYQMRRNKDEE
jgi:hypothetical protein